MTSAGYEYLSRLKRIFKDRQENDLAEHIKALCDQYYGLSVVKCRCLAYEFATKNNVTMPANWVRDGKAGVEWMMSFKSRHGLAIRQPEATSLARATALNRYVVDQFYDNLAMVMDKYKFAPKDIFNLDESGCHTVQTPGKVVTARGQKQVGSITSGERGELVTLVYTVSATGNTIPPMFILPRVHYRNHFINTAPHGSVGAANKSGWINVASVPDYLTHVVQNTRCTKEKPILLIMDNHETHMSLAAVDLAKANWIVLLTIPPHTSHRLQPLDRTVYGPFKTAYSVAMDGWMRSHPGRTVTIFDVPQIIKTAQAAAMTASKKLEFIPSIELCSQT